MSEKVNNPHTFYVTIKVKVLSSSPDVEEVMEEVSNNATYDFTSSDFDMFQVVDTEWLETETSEQYNQRISG